MVFCFSDYNKPFVWETYLQDSNGNAAQAEIFQTREPFGFVTGMKLECVDPLNPVLIRVSTIVDVRDYQIKIRFDGWPDNMDFWFDDDSPDIHPAGYSLKTGHPLQ